MWSYVKIPLVPNEPSSGVVSLEKYLVAEGDVIDQGDVIAVAHTECTSFDIVSNYKGRMLTLILRENSLVGFRDPIATLELMQDPIDGLRIEFCRVRN